MISSYMSKALLRRSSACASVVVWGHAWGADDSEYKVEAIGLPSCMNCPVSFRVHSISDLTSAATRQRR